MGEWIIAFSSPGCQGFLERLICGELKRGERYGHGEGGRIGDVEGAQYLAPEDVARALGDGAVGGAMELHALFDDVEGVHEGVAGYGRAGAA